MEEVARASGSDSDETVIEGSVTESDEDGEEIYRRRLLLDQDTSLGANFRFPIGTNGMWEGMPSPEIPVGLTLRKFSQEQKNKSEAEPVLGGDTLQQPENERTQNQASLQMRNNFPTLTLSFSQSGRPLSNQNIGGPKDDITENLTHHQKERHEDRESPAVSLLSGTSEKGPGVVSVKAKSLAEPEKSLAVPDSRSEPEKEVIPATASKETEDESSSLETLGSSLQHLLSQKSSPEERLLEVLNDFDFGASMSLLNSSPGSMLVPLSALSPRYGDLPGATREDETLSAESLSAVNMLSEAQGGPICEAKEQSQGLSGGNASLEVKPDMPQADEDCAQKAQAIEDPKSFGWQILAHENAIAYEPLNNEGNPNPVIKPPALKIPRILRRSSRLQKLKASTDAKHTDDRCKMTETILPKTLSSEDQINKSSTKNFRTWYSILMTEGQGKNMHLSRFKTEQIMKNKRLLNVKRRMNRMCPATINQRNIYGENLLYLAAMHDDVELVQQCIKSGGDVNQPSYSGWTALHEVSVRGFYQTASELLKGGADVDIKGMFQITPLHDAVINGHHKVVELLLLNGADPLFRNDSGNCALDEAKDSCMKDLLERYIPRRKKFLSSAQKTNMNPAQAEDVEQFKKPTFISDGCMGFVCDENASSQKPEHENSNKGNKGVAKKGNYESGYYQENPSTTEFGNSTINESNVNQMCSVGHRKGSLHNSRDSRTNVSKSKGKRKLKKHKKSQDSHVDDEDYYVRETAISSSRTNNKSVTHTQGTFQSLDDFPEESFELTIPTLSSWKNGLGNNNEACSVSKELHPHTPHTAESQAVQSLELESTDQTGLYSSSGFSLHKETMGPLITTDHQPQTHKEQCSSLDKSLENTISDKQSKKLNAWETAFPPLRKEHVDNVACSTAMKTMTSATEVALPERENHCDYIENITNIEEMHSHESLPSKDHLSQKSEVNAGSLTTFSQPEDVNVGDSDSLVISEQPGANHKQHICETPLHYSRAKAEQTSLPCTRMPSPYEISKRTCYVQLFRIPQEVVPRGPPPAVNQTDATKVEREQGSKRNDAVTDQNPSSSKSPFPAPAHSQEAGITRVGKTRQDLPEHDFLSSDIIDRGLSNISHISQREDKETSQKSDGEIASSAREDENTIENCAKKKEKMDSEIHVAPKIHEHKKELNRDGINHRNASGQSQPLPLASRRENMALVNILMEPGSDVNLKGNNEGLGCKPLHEAANEGFNDIIVELLKAGTDVNYENRDGMLPLHEAVASHIFKVGELLPLNGADPLLGNENGKCALDEAKDSCMKNLLEQDVPRHKKCHVLARRKNMDPTQVEDVQQCKKPRFNSIDCTGFVCDENSCSQKPEPENSNKGNEGILMNENYKCGNYQENPSTTEFGKSKIKESTINQTCSTGHRKGCLHHSRDSRTNVSKSKGKRKLKKHKKSQDYQVDDDYNVRETALSSSGTNNKSVTHPQGTVQSLDDFPEESLELSTPTRSSWKNGLGNNNEACSVSKELHPHTPHTAESQEIQSLELESTAKTGDVSSSGFSLHKETMGPLVTTDHRRQTHTEQRSILLKSLKITISNKISKKLNAWETAFLSFVKDNVDSDYVDFSSSMKTVTSAREVASTELDSRCGYQEHITKTEEIDPQKSLSSTDCVSQKNVLSAGSLTSFPQQENVNLYDSGSVVISEQHAANHDQCTHETPFDHAHGNPEPTSLPCIRVPSLYEVSKMTSHVELFKTSQDDDPRGPPPAVNQTDATNVEREQGSKRNDAVTDQNPSSLKSPFPAPVHSQEAGITRVGKTRQDLPEHDFLSSDIIDRGLSNISHISQREDKETSHKSDGQLTSSANENEITIKNCEEKKERLDSEIHVPPKIHEHKKGCTSVPEAAKGGYSDTIGELLNAGANVNCENMDGILPLHEAVASNLSQVRELIPLNGADPLFGNENGKCALDEAKDSCMKNLHEKDVPRCRKCPTSAQITNIDPAHVEDVQPFKKPRFISDDCMGFVCDENASSQKQEHENSNKGNEVVLMNENYECGYYQENPRTTEFGKSKIKESNFNQMFSVGHRKGSLHNSRDSRTNVSKSKGKRKLKKHKKSQDSQVDDEDYNVRETALCSSGTNSKSFTHQQGTLQSLDDFPEDSVELSTPTLLSWKNGLGNNNEACSVSKELHPHTPHTAESQAVQSLELESTDQTGVFSSSGFSLRKETMGPLVTTDHQPQTHKEQCSSLDKSLENTISDKHSKKLNAWETAFLSFTKECIGSDDVTCSTSAKTVTSATEVALTEGENHCHDQENITTIAELNSQESLPSKASVSQINVISAGSLTSFLQQENVNLYDSGSVVISEQHAANHDQCTHETPFDHAHGNPEPTSLPCIRMPSSYEVSKMTSHVELFKTSQDDDPRGPPPAVNQTDATNVEREQGSKRNDAVTDQNPSSSKSPFPAAAHSQEAGITRVGKMRQDLPEHDSPSSDFIDRGLSNISHISQREDKETSHKSVGEVSSTANEDETTSKTVRRKKKNWIQKFMYLLKSMSPVKNTGGINKRNASGQTQLLLASRRGNLSLVKILIECGADLNLKDNAGCTPLHEAANGGHNGIIVELLKAGANVNCENIDGILPLHEAVASHHLKAVEILLKYGANPNHKDHKQKTAWDEADDDQMKELLKSYGAIETDIGDESSSIVPVKMSAVQPKRCQWCSCDGDKTVLLPSVSNQTKRNESLSVYQTTNAFLQDIEKEQERLLEFEIRSPEDAEQYMAKMLEIKEGIDNILAQQKAERDALAKKYRVSMESFKHGDLREQLAKLATRQKSLLLVADKQKKLRLKMQNYDPVTSCSGLSLGKLPSSSYVSSKKNTQELPSLEKSLYPHLGSLSLVNPASESMKERPLSLETWNDSQSTNLCLHEEAMRRDMLSGNEMTSKESVSDITWAEWLKSTYSDRTEKTGGPSQPVAFGVQAEHSQKENSLAETAARGPGVSGLPAATNTFNFSEGTSVLSANDACPSTVTWDRDLSHCDLKRRNKRTGSQQAPGGISKLPAHQGIAVLGTDTVPQTDPGLKKTASAVSHASNSCISSSSGSNRRRSTKKTTPYSTAAKKKTMQLKDLISLGRINPGNILEFKAKETTYKASILLSGKLRGENGQIYQSPVTWLKDLLGNDSHVTWDYAWSNVTYLGKELLKYVSEEAPLPPEPNVVPQQQEPCLPGTSSKPVQSIPHYLQTKEILLISEEEFIPSHIMDKHWNYFVNFKDLSF